MVEYTLVGGPFDGRTITATGAHVVRMPIARPLEVFRKVVPIRPEPFTDTATYTRFGRIYWWEGLVGDAYCDMSLSEEMAADLGGKLIRRVIRDEMRRHLNRLANGKGLGRIVWRVTEHDRRRGVFNLRAFVGPRAVTFALDARSSRRLGHPIGHNRP